MDKVLFNIISSLITRTKRVRVIAKKNSKTGQVKWVRYIRRRKVRKPAPNKKDYQLHKEVARAFVHENLVKYQEIYKNLGIEIPPYKKVFIKNTVSRWGSCSNKQNLNFSYRLATIPVHLAEYIVVHELCHLREFNHGEGFWNLVALTIPEYEKCKEDLRKYSLRKGINATIS